MHVTIRALTQSTGAITNVASVTGREADIDLLNNASSVVAIVEDNPAVLSIEEAADGRLIISWPVAASNFLPQFAENLAAQTQWQPLNLAPVVSGGRFVITAPNTGVRRYFRLSRQ